MTRYITIDGGTTNTRIGLVENGTVKDVEKYSVGARAGIDDSNILKETVKRGIKNILAKNKLIETDITKIIASGMITSEFGLCCLEHIKTPVGIDELHNSMHEVLLSDISSVPFVFVRGVKHLGMSIEDIDVMRGEECELMGIEEAKNCVCVLPGSHSKIAVMDENGRIKSFTTLLSGELIAAVAENTILKSAIDLYVEDTDREYLMKGYSYTEKNSLNKALFKVRILNNFSELSKTQIYSFFMGIVLHGDIKEILKTDTEKIVVGGKKQLRNAICGILNNVSEKQIIELSDSMVSVVNMLGMIRVYENKL